MTSVSGVRGLKYAMIAEVRGSEREERQLQTTLEEKRATILLLSILERKEKIRQARFAEIARILGELRLGHSLAKSNFCSDSPRFGSAKASSQKEVRVVALHILWAGFHRSSYRSNWRHVLLCLL